MAANFSEMVANRAAGATRARLMNFYRSQGYDEPTATALAIAEMGRRAAPDYSIPDPGFEGPTSAPLVQALRDQARANPRELAATRSAVEDLPGFDPTAREFNAQQAAELLLVGSSKGQRSINRCMVALLLCLMKMLPEQILMQLLVKNRRALVRFFIS